MRTLVCVLALALPGFAQPAPGEDESPKIKQAILDYIEGWYKADAERMERALHPDLAKRMAVMDPRSGRSSLVNLSALTMVQAARRNAARAVAGAVPAEITILDKFGNSASVKAVSKDFVDYCHVVKWNGEWKIINVLWEMRQPPSAPSN